MSWFSALKRLKIGQVVGNIIISLAVGFFLPDRDVGTMTGVWFFGLLFLLPVMFIAGLLSSALFYSKHDFACIDPFYLRAYGAAIGGAVACPVCLLFRPIAAGFTFLLFIFGAGPVLAFHVYRQIAKHGRIRIRYR